MLRKALLATAAVAALSASAYAQPSANVFLTLEDADGNAIAPIAANTYQLAAGQQFWVVLNTLITDPRRTDTHRSGTTFDNQPLGLGALSVTIRSTNEVPSAPVVQPVGQDGAPTVWDHLAVVGSEAEGSVNLLDQGLDGDLDPTGAGISNALPSLGTSGQLARSNYGLPGKTAILKGKYVVVGGASVVLTPTATSINGFIDPVAASTALSAESLLGSTTGTPITILIPEPASLSLLGLGAMGLLARRRK